MDGQKEALKGPTLFKKETLTNTLQKECRKNTEGNKRDDALTCIVTNIHGVLL